MRKPKQSETESPAVKAASIVVGATAGTATGLAGSAAAISAAGTTAGLSGAGIMSGLSAIGGTALAGGAILTCGVAALAVGGAFAGLVVARRIRSRAKRK